VGDHFAEGRAPDVVALHIDATAAKLDWPRASVEDSAATLRVAYTSHGKPYFIDVPFPR
jgi:hypothetical protein